jgi:membrane protease YdiL (CAAX protease family)
VGTAAPSHAFCAMKSLFSAFPVVPYSKPSQSSPSKLSALLANRWSLRDAALGLPIALASYISYAISYYAIYYIHYAIYGAPIPQTPVVQIFGHLGYAAIPFVLVNPFFEELIVRAYLMTELIDLTGSSALAIAVSVALQFSYHLYYGWWNALSLAFQFLIFALFFAASRRALPIITAHALFDLYALLRLW